MDGAPRPTPRAGNGQRMNTPVMAPARFSYQSMSIRINLANRTYTGARTFRDILRGMETSHSDLALLAYRKHRGLVVSRIRKAGITGFADIEDLVSLVCDHLLSTEHLPEQGEEMPLINHAISVSIEQWRFERDRNGVPEDPMILEAS